MALKLGNIDITKTSYNKAYLGSTLVFGGGPTQYLRDLNSVNEDCLILPNSTLNTDIPATGDFEYGGVFTILSILSQAFTSLLGRLVFGASNGRYGVWLSSNGSLNVQVSPSSNTINIPNVVLNYKGQTIEIKVRYTSSGCDVLFDNVIVGSTTNTTRPSTSTTNFFVGAFGDGGGSNPSSGKYYFGEIHSVFHGANSWDFNEPSGFNCLNQDSLYPIEGQTSNTGGLTYWEANVIKEDI